MKSRSLSLRPALTALTLAIAATAIPVHAQSIGINFTGGQHQLLSTDQPGIVAGANWNNIIVPTQNNVALVNNSGTTTTAQVSYSAADVYDLFDAPSTSNAATNTLFQTAIYGNSATQVSVSLTGIPYVNYNVYVYASPDTTNTSTLSVSNGAVTYYFSSGGSANTAATVLLHTTSTNPLNPTAGPAQYQEFDNQSSSTFTLTTAGSVSGVISNNVYGIQIVATSAPEPAPLGLVFLALPYVGLIRRRKR